MLAENKMSFAAHILIASPTLDMERIFANQYIKRLPSRDAMKVWHSNFSISALITTLLGLFVLKASLKMSRSNTVSTISIDALVASLTKTLAALLVW